MKQNRKVRVLQSMRFDRLKRLTNLDGRSWVAGGTATAAVLLVVGGIAFASQSTTGPQTIDQAASLFHSASPSSSNSNVSPSSEFEGKKSIPSINNGLSTVTSPSHSLPTPTTVTGPSNNSTVSPPLLLTTTPSTAPTVPTTSTTAPLSLTVTTPSTAAPSISTTPDFATSTTVARPIDVNGTNSPVANIAVLSSVPDDPVVDLQVTGADSDGYVTSIVINWGDGTTSNTAYPLDACVDPLAASSHTLTPSHQYTTAGQYIITETVTSENCAGDATQAQSGLASTQQLTVGGTPPVSTPPAS